MLRCVSMCITASCRVVSFEQNSTPQHTATHCQTRQHAAAHCNTLQHPLLVRTRQKWLLDSFGMIHACWSVLQCVAVHHPAATHCNTLQHPWLVGMQQEGLLDSLKWSMCVAVFYSTATHSKHTATNILPHNATHTTHLYATGMTIWFFWMIYGSFEESWVLQCVAVCCSVLQCITVCYSVLQWVAVCCSVWQCVAVCCFAHGSYKESWVLQCVAVCCSVLQHVAVCGSVMFCSWIMQGVMGVVACCSVLQRVLVCSSV